MDQNWLVMEFYDVSYMINARPIFFHPLIEALAAPISLERPPMPSFSPAQKPTMHFIGVSTAKSSIMPIFPVWAEYLGLEGVLNGIDFVPGADPRHYRQVVARIKSDPLSLGALVTTHKVNLLKASSDLFDELDPFARTLHEVSSISKRAGRLIGHAMDPITVGQALKKLVPPGSWQNCGGHVLILGSGGSALALSLHLHNRAAAGDGPDKVTITAVDPKSLAEMRTIHAQIGFRIPVHYVLTSSPTDTDALIAGLQPGSLVVNATGLGKDAPGSPTSDSVRYPEQTTVWEFNYRGDLDFLAQAHAQEKARGLTVSDGWDYFTISWTCVIAEVFSVNIPTSGAMFEKLTQLARERTGR